MARKGKTGGEGPPAVSTLPPAPEVKPKAKRGRKPRAGETFFEALEREVGSKGGDVPGWARHAGKFDKPSSSIPRVKVELEPGPLGGKLKRTRKAKIVAPPGAVVIPGVSKRERAGKARPAAKTKPAPAEAVKAAAVPMTDDMFKLICADIAIGIPLRQICRRADRPSKSSVYEYLENEEVGDEIRAGRIARYARARKLGYDDIAEEALEIADDGSNDWMVRERDDGEEEDKFNGEHVQRSKLRVDTRLKLLAKWDPKRYGERLALSDPDGNALGREGKSASDLAIEIAKVVAAAKHEQGIIDVEIVEPD